MLSIYVKENKKKIQTNKNSEHFLSSYPFWGDYLRKYPSTLKTHIEK